MAEEFHALLAQGIGASARSRFSSSVRRPPVVGGHGAQFRTDTDRRQQGDAGSTAMARSSSSITGQPGACRARPSCRCSTAITSARQQHGLRVFAVTTEDSLQPYQLKKLFAVLHIQPVRRIKGSYDILKGVPTNYVIDRAGRLRYAKAGAFDLDDLNKLLVPLTQLSPCRRARRTRRLQLDGERRDAGQFLALHPFQEGAAGGRDEGEIVARRRHG